MSYKGQPMKRVEDPEFVTGQGCFVDDISLSGMLHAVVLRSPHAHANIRSINVSAAKDQPGVIAVLTGEDIAGIIDDIPARQMTSADSAGHIQAPAHPVLAHEKVRYVGQSVALVVAEERYIAQDALGLINVDYEPLVPLLDPFQALEDDAPIMHPELGTNVALRELREGGDLEGAFARADHVVRQRYVVPRVVLVPLETRGIVAEYHPQEDLLTVWNSTQAPHRVRSYISQLLDRPEDRIRVIAPDVGGSFGIKDCVFPEDILVPYLTLQLGRSIKWVEDRQENMLAYHGRGQALDIEAAVLNDGTLLGIRVQIVSDLGAYFLLTTSSAPLNAGRRIMGPYKTPAARVEVLGVTTNKTPTGAFRGTGGPESAYCMERTLDIIAKDLRLDPSEVRRKNFIAPDSFPYETPIDVTYDSGNYEVGLDRVLELVEYSSWREKATARRADEPLLGIGLATVLKSSGSTGEHRIERARVKIEDSGLIKIYTGISPHGQGSETAFAQIVADELGIYPSRVEVLHSDTSIIDEGMGTSASRGLIVGGSAVHSVAQDARDKLAHIAAYLLSCRKEDVDFIGGGAFNRMVPDETITFERLAAVAYNEELLPPDMEPGLDFTKIYTLPASPYSFAAHAVVVEVSRDTGEVKILRYAGVNDCGRLINPKLVEGQFHGGITQGVAQALTEAMVYDDEGQPLTGSLMDYAIPIAEEFPEPILENMETLSPTNLLGAKGVGSVSTVPAPVAVANAVLDALSTVGVRHIDSPLTPEKIWNALQGQRGN